MSDVPGSYVRSDLTGGNDLLANGRGAWRNEEKTLEYSYKKFCSLMTLAERCMEAGDHVASARLAEIAARYAFPGHAGLFFSPRLEGLLCRLGREIPEATFSRSGATPDKRKQVVHVMTYAKPLGGDSRLVWRWIQQDPDSCHSVVITSQAEVEDSYRIPDVLLEAVSRSGGSIRALQQPKSNPLAQARELRQLCRTADVVLLHLFPYDIVPVIALSSGCDGLRVGLVNHADHAFWIGGSVANWIVHLREQEEGFLSNRRGLDPARSSIVPIPLGDWRRCMGKAEAKRALGYGPDTVVLLTIASEFKYNARGRTSFLELVKEVVREAKNCVLFAVGPSMAGEWLAAANETDGRIIALGKRWDNEILNAAADIYLDSVPFASITSVLEAGSHGVPALGFAAFGDELPLLSAGAPGLSGVLSVTSDQRTYRNMLWDLIRDPHLRETKGKQLQERILSFHTGPDWVRAIQEVYAGLEGSDGGNCVVGIEDRFSADAYNVALVQLYGNSPFRLQDLMRRYVGTLPYGSRLDVSLALWRLGLGFCAINVVPPPVDKMVRWIARSVMRGVAAFRRPLRRSIPVEMCLQPEA